MTERRTTPAYDSGRSVTPTSSAVFDPTGWIGDWASFERFIESDDPSVRRAWDLAEQAMAGTPMAAMAGRGIRAFWSDACRTTSDENPIRIGGWSIRPLSVRRDTDGMRVTDDAPGFMLTWLDGHGAAMHASEYRFVGTVPRGLEGKPTLMFHADATAPTAPSAPAASNAFDWLLAIEPMPSRDERPDGGPLSHLHFQYASSLDTLIDPKTGALRNRRWYATMCDASGTTLERCNVILALHRVPLWRELPAD